MTDRGDFRPSRRIVFQGFGALGVAAALAGCGGSGEAGEAGEAVEGPSTGTTLASVSEVPVGGGLILTAEKIVITQPTEGDFRGFTAVCTHQGNTVTGVEDGAIQCNFHGSSFSLEDGAVAGGPAGSALAEVAIAVEGDQIVSA